MITKLRMTEEQHTALRSHLLPADGGEAAAVMLCGRASSPDVHTLVGKEVVLIPLSDCVVRGPDRLEWRTDRMVPLIERARREHLAVVKLHSHPGGFAEFSHADDRADTALFDSIHGWVEDGLPHASVVMLPDGVCFGRRTFGGGRFEPLASIEVAGRRIEHWPERARDPSAFTLRHAQAFGSGTAGRLQQMSIAVIGCSGTGSVVTELLARLGVGRLVLVDPDVVEEKNLNRILHASVGDAAGAVPKVEVARRAISESGLPVEVVPIHGDLLGEAVIRAVASCDIVFGCVDAYLPRRVLGRMATFYNLPYIDVGVRLDADGWGGLSQICGAVHYVRPGGDTLDQRGAIDPDGVRAESVRRGSPEEYARQVRAKYIQGARENSPAVISLNAFFAGLAVTELLARLHPFRADGPAANAHIAASLFSVCMVGEAEGPPDPAMAKWVGAGDVLPLLDMALLRPPGREDGWTDAPEWAVRPPSDFSAAPASEGATQ